MFTNGFWYTYDDVPAGGTSKAWPSPDRAFVMSFPGFKGKDECACLKGSVTTAFEFGFIGMGYYLSPMNVRASFDISTRKVVSFWQKGDGKSYRIKLVSTVADFINGDSDNQYGFDFKTTVDWQKVEIPLEKLTQQPGWGSQVPLNKALFAVKEIQFMTLGAPLESVELWIDGLNIV